MAGAKAGHDVSVRDSRSSDSGYQRSRASPTIEPVSASRAAKDANMTDGTAAEPHPE